MFGERQTIKMKISLFFILLKSSGNNQKQPSRGVLRTRYSESVQQIYWRTPMSKCDFPVNFQHNFRTHFYKNTYGGLLLKNKKTKKFP